MSELVTQEMVDAAFHAVYAEGAKNIKWTALRKGIEAALNARKPEPGQPATEEFNFILQCKCGWKGNASELNWGGEPGFAFWQCPVCRQEFTEFPPSLPKTLAQPAAGQREPVAEQKEYAYAVEETSYGAMLFFDGKEAYSYCADDEHPIKLYAHPIPAAPAVPVVGWLYHNPHLSEKFIGFKYGPDRPDERESWKPLAIVEQQDNAK